MRCRWVQTCEILCEGSLNHKYAYKCGVKYSDVLKITNTGAVRNFEVLSDKFIAVELF
jgi:hypothetical protein